MSDKKLFSQYYSTDPTKYEDKEKFRLRLLKYLEDFVNHNFPTTIELKCRSQMGLNIPTLQWPTLTRPDQVRYMVESLFAKRSVSDILDFVGVCYGALEPHQSNNPSLRQTLKTYIKEVNVIFREESMCYEMHDDGRVRYYPDTEFQHAVKSTLIILHKHKYHSYLTAFNDSLDDMYKNPNTESPLNKLFKTIESISLSMLNDSNHNRLNRISIDALFNLFKDKSELDKDFTKNDRDALNELSDTFGGWVNANHKYRHGKPEQQHSLTVPAPLFNSIFSTGISILRLLIELDEKWHLLEADSDNKN